MGLVLIVFFEVFDDKSKNALYGRRGLHASRGNGSNRT